MKILASAILNQAGRQLGAFLPRFAGAIALLLIGILVVSLFTRVLIKAMQAAHVDDLAGRAGVNHVLEQAGLGPSLAVVVGRAIRIALIIVVVFAALSLLGLQFLSDSLNKGIQELPKLLIAAALLLAGIVIAGYARERADRLSTQMDLPVPLGRLAQITVLAIFGIIAAAQIAISTLVLLLLVGILLAGVSATFAIAFGLGGRDAASALSAGRYLHHSYQIGQNISFSDVRGTITAIEPSATLLKTTQETLIRVPNQILMQTIVTIHPDHSSTPEPPPEEHDRS
ncbi:MAG: mechanosensitive ion channel domain-containing protein [Solirubrobacteraceae bacterium]